MIFLLDNYDSFTYNLVDYFYRAGAKVLVKRNDAITVNEIETLKPRAIVLSPGPETPAQSGILTNLVNKFAGKVPILGICLGHQAIGEYLGMQLIKAPIPVHGKTSWCTHNNHLLFNKVPRSFNVMRYHSLILANKNINGLEIPGTTTNENLIMVLHHQKLMLTGFQFHPESVLTPFGLQMIKNWIGIYQLAN